MRNKYAGICTLCKNNVDVGKGHFERRNGRWFLKHAYCVLEDRERKSNISSTDNKTE